VRSSDRQTNTDRPYLFAGLTILSALGFTALIIGWSSCSPEMVLIGLDGHHDARPGATERLAACLDCHVPFIGAPPSRCLSPGCHGELATGTPPREGKAMPVRFHAALRPYHCSTCHTEHGDERVKTSSPTFTHEIIPASERAACGRCHSGRNAAAHPATNAVDCAICHETKTWKGGGTDHTKVWQYSCEACHAAPNTPSHASIAGACTTCHVTANWAPKPDTADEKE
jgi:hypothetical protein